MSQAMTLSAVAIVQSPACDTLRRVFAKNKWKLAVAETRDRGLVAIRASANPIVILDRDLAGPDWRPAVRQLASEARCGCVILASRVVDDYLLEEVIQHGGYDVLAKPFSEQEVGHAMEFAWAHCKSKQALRV